MTDEIEVKPAAGRHAIEVMALAVEWVNPVSDEVIAEIDEFYKTSTLLKDFLPKSESLKGYQLLIGEDGAAVNSTVSGGLQWSRHSDDGTVTWIVHIRPDLISCSCMDYSRWDTTKAQVLDILLPIIDLISHKGYLIQATGVQYQDAFALETGSPTLGTRRLFQLDSVWLSPRIRTEDGPWHIHQGWFSAKPGGSVIHNVLNVDLTLEPELTKCIIRINGQHRMLTTDMKGSALLPIQSSDIPSALDALHIQNKKVLSQLLAKSVCDQIGLKYEEEL